MNRRHYRPLMLVALALVGCGLSPGEQAQAPTMVDVLSDAGSYQLLATSSPLSLIGVTPSSTRNSFFPATNVDDGKFTSAWGPAASDSAPTLLLQLNGSTTLDALAIKLSLGRFSSSANQRVQVDVAVSNGGSAFQTIATGLTPSETVLSTLALPETTADQVRLSFHVANGLDISQLLVCEAELLGGAASDPSPNPTGTAASTPPDPAASTPANPPSASPPVVLPSISPQGCADAQGAGTILSAGLQIKFDFLAHINPTQGDSGQIQVTDVLSGATYKGDVTNITYDQATGTATITGNLTSGGSGPFTIVAVESTIPGKSDSFSFTSGLFSASGPLIRGNVRTLTIDCP